MESPMPEWLKPMGVRIGWILVGVLLTLFALWCYRQYGKEVAFQMYVRALKEKPADMEAVEHLFAGSKRMIVAVSEDFGHFRYRFSGGADIDVVFDRRSRRVIDMNPTFTADGFGLLLLLHRRQLFTVHKVIPPEKGK